MATLEELSIPSLDWNQNLDKLELEGPCSSSLRISPQSGVGEAFGDQCNSEDSSLSDSDRTLVGEAPGEIPGLISSNSNSPADQHMASPCDPCEDNYNYDVLGHNDEEMNWDYLDSQCDSQHINYYFKVTSMIHNSETNPTDNRYTRCCRILVDKGMTLEKLKKHLEVILRVSSEYFKVYKQYHNSEDEWTKLSDTLRSLKDGEKLVVKLGRVLQKDEFICNVYLLKLDSMDNTNFLFEHIVAKGQTVGAVKRDIIVQAKKQHKLDIPYNKCRLRGTNWKRPKKVYLDDQKFVKDISVYQHMDIFLQELNSAEPVTSKEQLVILVRQWCPSTLSLKPFQEVVLDNCTMEELKKQISILSGILPEHLDVVYIKGHFPCDIHVLDIHNELEWNPNVTQLEHWPINVEDGSVFYFRNSQEPLKELTPEERKEINQKEKSRLDRVNGKSYVYSPGRERALKIYLDTPDKSEDCID